MQRLVLQDLFTEEAYRGMLEVVKYARYVESQQEVEERPGEAPALIRTHYDVVIKA